MDVTLWLNLGIGGAVVFVVRLFLNHLRRQQQACERCRSEQHEVTKAFSNVVANHMRHEVEARDRLAEAIHSLEALIRQTVEPTQSAHNRR